MRVFAFLLLTTSLANPAFAWDAQCANTGKFIEVEWPIEPYRLAKDGNHEIQYRFKGESELRIGEVTGWISKCYGQYCPSATTKNFELNTFSEYYLMYCFPVDG
jgi:hypothetical protein